MEYKLVYRNGIAGNQMWRKSTHKPVCTDVQSPFPSFPLPPPPPAHFFKFSRRVSEEGFLCGHWPELRTYVQPCTQSPLQNQHIPESNGKHWKGNGHNDNQKKQRWRDLLGLKVPSAFNHKWTVKSSNSVLGSSGSWTQRGSLNSVPVQTAPMQMLVSMVALSPVSMQRAPELSCLKPKQNVVPW